MRKLIGGLLVAALALAGSAMVPAAGHAAPVVRDGSTLVAVPDMSAAEIAAAGAGIAAASPAISPTVSTIYVPRGGYFECPYEYLCTSVWDPNHGMFKIFYMWHCYKYTLYNWNGWGTYKNFQTPNAITTFYGQSHNVLTSFGPVQNAQFAYDWTPVWYIRNC